MRRLPALLLLAACAATDVPPARYACDAGVAFTAVFADESVELRFDDGTTLPQTPAGSGFWYRTPQHEFRGKGAEATYTRGRMVPLKCRVQS